MSEMSISPLVSTTLDAARASSLKGTREKLAVLNLSGEGKTNDPLDAALEEFQNLLVKEMVKTMRASVPESTLYTKSSGEKIFESMLDEKYAESFGGPGGSLGLTEAMKEQFKPQAMDYFNRPEKISEENPILSIPAVPNFIMKGDDHSE